MLNVIVASALVWQAQWQPQNRRCANSQFATGDFVHTKRGNEIVVIIRKIVDGDGKTVGWAFVTSAGNQYGQITPLVSRHDQLVVDMPLMTNDRLSGLFPLETNPWHDLRIHTCSRDELVSAKYVPWKGPHA